MISLPETGPLICRHERATKVRSNSPFSGVIPSTAMPHGVPRPLEKDKTGTNRNQVVADVN